MWLEFRFESEITVLMNASSVHLWQLLDMIRIERIITELNRTTINSATNAQRAMV